jgi:phenylalanyl-tRNA synthetase beta chain
MKLIYSYLQKFLPGLDVEPQKLRDDLTMIGHFTNYFEQIEDEIVFDMDIKVNRGDCLGYYGLAQDLSVLYDLPLTKIPDLILPADQLPLPISVTSPDVTRVMSAKISNVKVSSSPDWLVKFIKLHNINTVNNIVDLTNYVMFMYGIPNHAFDTNISSDHLIWENNHGKNSKFTTLDGTILNLTDDNLVISNPQEVLSTDLVGGKNSGINNTTTNIIIEVAIYNRIRIRLDSKELKTVTEASIRLEKDLDPDTIPLAFNQLTKLIVDNCGGQISSSIYDYYPNPATLPQIEFDFSLPGIISGINIPSEFGDKTLLKLGCQINGNIISPPSIRKDISIPEDLSEEIIRFFGYDKIPKDQPLITKTLTDITPKEIYQIEELKDKLVALGYDEVLTWPLVNSPVDQTTVITTQNSINSESIYLRQSLIPSLKQQLDQYLRYKLPQPQFFEIGKIFYQENGKYIEKNALGIYNQDPSSFEKLGLDLKIEGNFAEIILDNLPKPDNYIPPTQNNNAVELTSQIITLDANVNLTDKKDPLELIKEYSSKIDPAILWSMEIVDIYENRYTFRVSYYNCDDKTAKKIHLSTFNLNDTFTNPS